MPPEIRRPSSSPDLRRPRPEPYTAPVTPTAPSPTPQMVRPTPPTPVTTTTIAPTAPTAPTTVQDADLILTRNEATREVQRLTQELRAATLRPRGTGPGMRNQEEINRIAQVRRDVMRQGAAADRLLRDRTRATLSPEELARSQANLIGQYQGIREGAIIRARTAEERARGAVDRIRASGGAAAGLDAAQRDLNAAMIARQQAESRPETLTFETPTPDEIESRERSRTLRISGDEQAVQQALAARGSTGSTLPTSAQAYRSELEAVRQAEQQRAVREASGVTVQDEANLRLVDAQVARSNAEVRRSNAETERLRAETGTIGANSDIDRARGQAEVSRLQAETQLINAQVATAIDQIDDRRAIDRLTRSAAADEEVLSVRPELATIASGAAAAFADATGQTFQVGTSNRQALTNQINAVRALPEAERRIVYRQIWKALVANNSTDLLQPQTPGGRTTVVGNLFSRAVQTLSEDMWGGASDAQAEREQKALQIMLNEFGAEIVRLGQGG